MFTLDPTASNLELKTLDMKNSGSNNPGIRFSLMTNSLIKYISKTNTMNENDQSIILSLNTNLQSINSIP